MKFNFSHFLYSATVLVALGSTALVQAQTQADQAVYKTISGTLQLDLNKREDKFSVSAVKGDNGTTHPLLTRTESNIDGKMSLSADGLPAFQSKAYKPNLSKVPVTIEFFSANKVVAHLTPGSSSGDVPMVFNYARGCFTYDPSARDHLITQQSSDFSTNTGPKIVKSLLSNPDVARVVQLKPGTSVSVTSISNNHADNDECFTVTPDGASMTYQPSSIVLNVQLTILDQSATSDGSTTN